MKKFVSLLLVMLLAFALVGCGAQESAAPAATDAAAAEKTDSEVVIGKGTAVVGITDFAPMDYKGEDGNWTGFDAELATIVFDKLGCKVELTEIDWDNKILELDAGTIDCVWNGMTLTDEVKNAMECTKPYVLNAQVVVMPKANIKGDETEESLATVNYAVEAGSAGEITAGDFGFENVTPCQTQAAALMEVAAGTNEACIIDLTMANAMTGEGTSYPDLGICYELTNEEYGIGFRKGSDLAAKVDEILDQMRADGSLKELADKYGLSLVD